MLHALPFTALRFSLYTHRIRARAPRLRSPLLSRGPAPRGTPRARARETERELEIRLESLVFRFLKRVLYCTALSFTPRACPCATCESEMSFRCTFTLIDPFFQREPVAQAANH